MKFSQKIGKTPIREKIQIEAIDERLENRLWNTMLDNFFGLINNESSYLRESQKGQVCRYIWKEFFGKRADEAPSYINSSDLNISSFLSFLKEWFFESQWYEKYDLIEFLSVIDLRSLRLGFVKNCNYALKKEMAGYRIVDECVVQITSEEEIVEIEEALNRTSKWESVNTHLATALEYFSNRENPDYRNSVKESISAVEALCIIITDDKKATLGKALSEIEKRFSIHGALKSGFSALYGYASDSGGIRHSLLEDDLTVSFEDAKFMLVSCSAFINYLRLKIEK